MREGGVPARKKYLSFSFSFSLFFSPNKNVAKDQHESWVNKLGSKEKKKKKKRDHSPNFKRLIDSTYEMRLDFRSPFLNVIIYNVFVFSQIYLSFFFFFFSAMCEDSFAVLMIHKFVSKVVSDLWPKAERMYVAKRKQIHDD